VVAPPQSTLGLGKLAPGPGNLGLRQQPVRSPDEGEALLEVIAAGICGTDLHIADDEFPSSPPVTMGHEVTGEVVAVGSDADEHLLGSRVACETYFHYCGDCDHCRSGFPNLCPDRRSIGSAVDGGFARWLTVPVRNLHPLPESIGNHAGALVEPLACVCQCLFDPDVVESGDRVLVIGPGTMGILTAQAARAAGGDVVVVGLERDRDRLAVAQSLGITAVVLDELSSNDFDVVCECSGAEPAVTLGLDLIRKQGRYVQVGIFGRPVTVPLDQVLYKEVTLTSGNASTPTSWRRAVSLLEQGLIDLDPLVTDVVPLAEWERAFAATRRGEGVKVVLDPRVVSDPQ
jgi:L-iditol 2-dehydrogenase